MNFEDFTEDDWHQLMGCGAFPDGHRPMIARDIPAEGFPMAKVAVIVDGGIPDAKLPPAVSVYLGMETNGSWDETFYELACPGATRDQLIEIANTLPVPITEAELRRRGFECHYDPWTEEEAEP